MIRQAVFAVLVIAILAAVIEVLVRIFAPTPRYHDPRFISNLEWDYPECIIKDHDLFWRFRPNQTIAGHFFVTGTYTINSRGLRTPEFAVPKPQGTTRVVCLGNSCTFGYGVMDAATYARQLEGMLQQAAPQSKWEVINAGITGYSSLQGLRLARWHLAEWQPDVVTICYGWNDHWIAAGNIMDRDQDLPPQWQLDLQNLLSRSLAYRWLKYPIFTLIGSKTKNPPGPPTVRVIPDDYTVNIGQLISFCHDLGARVVLLTPPIAKSTDASQNRYPALANFHQRYIRRTRLLAGEQQTGLVDAARAFEDHPEFFDRPTTDFIHYNARGHRLIAELLSETILHGSASVPPAPANSVTGALDPEVVP